MLASRRQALPEGVVLHWHFFLCFLGDLRSSAALSVFLRVLLLLRGEVLTLNGHCHGFRTVVPRQGRVESFHQGWSWQPRVQRARVVRKAETTAGEAAGTRSSVFVAVEVCARTLSDRRLRWRVSTEGALGSACWRGPARRENRRESTRGDQLGSEDCKGRYVRRKLGERCLLE